MPSRVRKSKRRSSAKRVVKRSARRSAKRSVRKSRRSRRRVSRKNSRRVSRKVSRRSRRRATRKGSRKVSRKSSRRVSRKNSRRTKRRSVKRSRRSVKRCSKGVVKSGSRKGSCRKNRKQLLPTGVAYETCKHCPKTNVVGKLVLKDTKKWLTLDEFSSARMPHNHVDQFSVQVMRSHEHVGHFYLSMNDEMPNNYGNDVLAEALSKFDNVSFLLLSRELKITFNNKQCRLYSILLSHQDKHTLSLVLRDVSKVLHKLTLEQCVNVYSCEMFNKNNIPEKMVKYL